MPLISFIVPCYNIPTAMLRECIKSILALDMRDDEREIIIVDDGSDSSPINEIQEIIERCLYIRQRNRGPSAARNAGLKIASGEYVQFVDSDDTLIKERYEACIDIIDSRAFDVVMMRLTHEETEGKRHADRRKRLAKSNAYDKDMAVTGSMYMKNNNLRGGACGYAFRKDILGGLMYDESLVTDEDEDFTPRLLLRAEHVIDTDIAAYYYRQRDTSLTGTKDERHVSQRLANKEQVIYKLKELTYTLPDVDKPAISRRVAQLTMDYLYKIITLTHSSEKLEDAVERLSGKGLFPLPAKNYTKKYTAFRMAVSSKLTRRLLVKLCSI